MHVKPRSNRAVDEEGNVDPNAGEIEHAKSVDVLDVFRPFSYTDDQLVCAAVICAIGESCDMSQAQAYVLMRAFYDRPALFSLKEWMTHLLNIPNGILNSHYHKQARGLHNLKFVNRSKEAFMKNLQDTVCSKRDLLRRVMSLQLKDCSWDDVHGTGLKPLTTSYFMMQTRPCECVALTAPVLRWMKNTPAMRSKNSLKPQVYPDKAPEDKTDYRAAEMRARKMQRLYYPGMTSIEAERIIIHGTLGLLKGPENG